MGDPSRALAADSDADNHAELREKVFDALQEIEQEKEVARREEELVERREEAVRAIAEYDAFADELETRVAKLLEQLYLDDGQVKGLRSALTIQNDRNREMTRLWAEGNTSEEELRRIFRENRKAHRSEVKAFLGEEQLGTYRQFMTRGGLGPRFSFFIGPKEVW